jgi:hypothetical protein
VKREPLKPYIQEGKKGLWGLLIVFMEMQPVIEVFQRNEPRAVFGVLAWLYRKKMTGTAGVVAGN